MQDGGPLPVVDLHCHVLPGIDDGAPDVETSLRFLRLAREGGTTDVVATPHQHPGRYPNTAERIRAAHATLLEAMRRSGEELPRVHVGAEVHLDGDLRRLVASGELLRLAGPWLLLELPDVFRMKDVEQLVFELQVDGVRPILAHPERIGQFLRQPDQLMTLIGRGALGQATGSSIAGVFGEPCRAVTERWIREGLLHVVASDAHEMRRRTTDLRAARSEVARLFGEPAAALMLSERPRAVLEGRAVTTEPPPAPLSEGPARRGSGWRRWLGGSRPSGRE